MRSGWAYAQQKAAEYKKAIERVSCGAAQFLKDTGSALVEFTASFDLSEIGHTALDAAGMLPGIGAAADVANGLWYAAEGNYADAALSFASAVPGAGDAIGAAKLGAKAAATAVSAVSGAAKGGEAILAGASGVVSAKKAVEAASTSAVDIHLKYPKGISAADRAAADAKVKALSEGETIKTKVENRSTSASRVYKKEYGEDSIPANHDIDHVIDLQLGGADDISNMKPLPSTVNRSLGAQIAHQIKEYPEGTRFGDFTISD